MNLIRRSFLCFLVTALSACFILVGAQKTNAPATRRPPNNGTIRPQDMADSLHLVLAADREAYNRLELTRAGTSNGAKPPSPCELFRRAAERVQSQGAEFHYALRSIAPSVARNAPATEIEKTGLAAVVREPARPFYHEETLGGRRYFTAIYSDTATSGTCLQCHRSRPDGQPARVGDVLGGVVIRVALEF